MAEVKINTWVTIATFYYVHQAAMLQGRIESEGILCTIKDEHTATANPLYSNAIGGIKMQVRDSDVQKVIPLLKELGYNTDDDESYEVFIKGIIRFTQKIPVINKYPLEKRYTVLSIVAVVMLAIILSIVYYCNR